mgnify:CR=1 FL=1
MILAVDIGNSNIVIGGIDGEKILFEARLRTDSTKTSDEYCIDLKMILEVYGVKQELIEQYFPTERYQLFAVLTALCPTLTSARAKQLEEELAAYVGRKHCISCANGTDALQIAFMVYGIGEGDAVFCPDITFISSTEGSRSSQRLSEP